MFGLLLCLCTTCIPSAFGGQKRRLDYLKLELQMVVSHDMDLELNPGPLEGLGAGNQTQVLGRVATALNH